MNPAIVVAARWIAGIAAAIGGSIWAKRLFDREEEVVTEQVGKQAIASSVAVGLSMASVAAASILAFRVGRLERKIGQ